MEMKNKIETDLLISELIYKHLKHEISQDEQEILDSWLESEDNGVFLASLKESDRLYKDLIHVHYLDKEGQFQELRKRIRRRKYRHLWKITIGVAAVLSIGIGSQLFFSQEQFPVKTPFLVQLPEENQTFLRTPEGRTIYLADSIKEISLQESGKIESVPGLKIQHIPASLKYNVLATSTHGKIEIILADSTRVWLNAGSELRYPEVFGENERKVYLTGEAYFEVTKNQRCPFIVDTKKARIEVLGTQFNVNAYQDRPCITTLVEGCVKMQDQKHDPVILRPGEQAVATLKSGIRSREVDVRYYIAWKKNQFAFQDVTLYTIMSELADWYDFTFDFENPELGNLTYTAIIPRFSTVDEVLELLGRTDDFSYVREDGGHIRICEKRIRVNR